VTGPASVVWDDSLAAYDFGAGHPLAPIRVQLAMHLVRDLGLLEPDHVTVIPPDQVDDDLLRTVHEPDFVDAVRRSSEDPDQVDLHRGLGTDDVPTFRGMHEASRAVCGATLAAVRSVHEGRALHSVNLAGGLHHAMPGSAAGFCVYNDLAIGIQWLLDHRVERVAYIDVDVHHGDGVQAFWNDPRVLDGVGARVRPRAVPGTGFPMEIGGPDALGSAVNVALPPGTGDEGWLRAFHGVVPAVVEHFKPEILVTQQGCDTHADDSAGALTLSVDGQRLTYRPARPAHRVTDGRWVATGGGGYSGSTSSRALGRTWSPSSSARPSSRDPAARVVAIVRHGPPQGAHAGAHDRRRRPEAALVGVGLQPGRPHRRRRAAHPGGRLPLARTRRRPLPRLLTPTGRLRA
jgi:acetoin utilization protein AcuC